MRAIISVSDKTGVIEFARGLNKLGYEIFSTGGTQKVITGAGIAARSIPDMTGFPEILDGRVKTLHPSVYGGILARRDIPAHMQELAKHEITPIDLVAINLYPFVQTVSREGVNLDAALENIDIGGPTMLRASAKNFPSVIVLVDPNDYQMVLEKLTSGGLEISDRKRLAQKAFQHVAVYDTAISQYLREAKDIFPEEMTIAVKKRYGLRYGENPHQQAAFYSEQLIGKMLPTGITWAEILHGGELSYNNVLDADAAWGCVTDFAAPTVTIFKHASPCGLASHKDIVEAYRRAYSGDPVSAFGGTIASNYKVNQVMAEEMKSVSYEIVVAPDYDPEALDVLKQKTDLRIMRTSFPPGYGTAEPVYTDFRRVKGGFLVQTSDSIPENKVTMKTVTRREPSKEEIEDLLFAWRAVKHVKSNAIVIARDKTLLGIGAGQPNWAIAARLAKERAGEKTKGSVLAADAVFPFSDVVESAAAGVITAIIQTGGSIRDEESIRAADKYNIAMVFTGERHFRH